MAFQKYSNTNYAKGTLNAAIDASSTSLVLDAGQGGRFPDTPTENSFFLRIYQFSDDTQTFIARQEIIKCNARVSDILSIDRGADYITADSDANTQTNTAFAFDPNNGTVFVDQVVCNAQVEDIQDEIERLETEKVSIVALQDNTHLYGESSTGTDAYALSLTPTLTAYVDGQIFSFKADVENVGPCTINVDGLGALDVKKRGNIDLETGDIKADQDVLFQVDGRNAQMLSQTGSVSAGGSPQVVSICTAGEDITGSDNEGICFMGTGEQDVASATSNTATLFGDLAASEKVRVVLDPSSFNSSVLRNLTLELGKVGAPADGINVNFFATVDAAEVPAFSDNQLFIDESEIP